jgi:XTP/dITP diphosphohydrolase
VFWQADHKMTSAQLPRDLKNQLSHRGQALKKLVPQLLEALR